MPISGPVVHQQLMDAYARTQEKLDSERERVLNAKDKRDRLDDERSDALRSLAEHYLPELTKEAIHETWGEVREAVSEILARKEDEARRQQEELERLSAKRTLAEDQLVDLNRDLDEAQQAQKEVALQVERRLQDDQDFVMLSDRAAIAEAALERAEANLHEIDQEAVRKLPGYEESSLFHYLYDRGYGTPKYSKRGFTRRMDRWLARYIDFSKAKQGYDFLKQTPDQMREIIAEDRKSLDLVMGELEGKRDRVARELGLPAKIRESRDLEKRRESHLTILDEVVSSTEQLQIERTELEDPRGPYYRKAIEAFRKQLEQYKTSDLRDRAEQTETDLTDDQIVARISGVESDIGDLDDATRRQRDGVRDLQDFLEELGRVIQRFRAAQFDSNRSQFIGTLDIDEEVDQAEKGDDAQDLWQRIRRAQRWGSVESESSSTGSSLKSVLVNAMGNAAGSERADQARRAGARRADDSDSNHRSADWSGDSSRG